MILLVISGLYFYKNQERNFLIIVGLFALFIFLCYPNLNIEGMTETEKISTIASIYNNESMKVKDLEVTGNLTVTGDLRVKGKQTLESDLYMTGENSELPNSETGLKGTANIITTDRLWIKSKKNGIILDPESSVAVKKDLNIEKNLKVTNDLTVNKNASLLGTNTINGYIHHESPISLYSDYVGRYLGAFQDGGKAAWTVDHSSQYTKDADLKKVATYRILKS